MNRILSLFITVLALSATCHSAQGTQKADTADYRFTTIGAKKCDQRK